MGHSTISDNISPHAAYSGILLGVLILGGLTFAMWYFSKRLYPRLMVSWSNFKNPNPLTVYVSPKYFYSQDFITSDNFIIRLYGLYKDDKRWNIVFDVCNLANISQSLMILKVSAVWEHKDSFTFKESDLHKKNKLSPGCSYKKSIMSLSFPLNSYPDFIDIEYATDKVDKAKCRMYIAKSFSLLERKI